MEERKECEVYQSKEAILHHGEFFALCDFIKAALRLSVILGEPAKKAIAQIAKTIDYYTSSPQDDAHKAFAEKCREFGSIQGRKIIAQVRAEGYRLARKLGSIYIPPMPELYRAKLPPARVYKIEYKAPKPSSSMHPNLRRVIREKYGKYADYVERKRRYSYPDMEKAFGKPSCTVFKKVIGDYSRDNPYRHGARCIIGRFPETGGRKAIKCIYPNGVCVCYLYD